MVTITEVLEVNWVIIYFIYGQAFFVMGLVTGLQLRQSSRIELARALPWLAAFGISHGLVEWGYIFVPAQALYLDDAPVRLLMLSHMTLLAASFSFLLQFGVELLVPFHPGRRKLRVVPSAVFLLWGILVLVRAQAVSEPLNVLLAIGDSWSRYLLCLPGAALAYLGLRRQARQVAGLGLARISAYLTGAAVAFLVYAAVGGLLSPVAPVFPANILNYAWVERVVSLPVPVFRSLCGLAMAVLVVRSLDVFRVESERDIAEMEEARALAADRERIGRELHDGIIQNIYAAGLLLERMERQLGRQPEHAEQARSVLEILDRSIQDIRSYVFDLRATRRPHELEVILSDLVRDMHLDTMLNVSLTVTGQRCCLLGGQAIAHLTQIAREALSNIVRHAQATRVGIDLDYAPGRVRLAIADDGRGIDGEAYGHRPMLGRGIANMRERSNQLGGEMRLARAPDGGTVLEIIVPCPRGGGIDLSVRRIEA